MDSLLNRKGKRNPFDFSQSKGLDESLYLNKCLSSIVKPSALFIERRHQPSLNLGFCSIYSHVGRSGASVDNARFLLGSLVILSESNGVESLTAQHYFINVIIRR